MGAGPPRGWAPTRAQRTVPGAGIFQEEVTEGQWDEEVEDIGKGVTKGFKVQIYTLILYLSERPF